MPLPREIILPRCGGTRKGATRGLRIGKKTKGGGTPGNQRNQKIRREMGRKRTFSAMGPPRFRDRRVKKKGSCIRKK